MTRRKPATPISHPRAPMALAGIARSFTQRLIRPRAKMIAIAARATLSTRLHRPHPHRRPPAQARDRHPLDQTLSLSPHDTHTQSP